MLKNLTKQDLSILIGNALDHFDIALYGFLAPILAPLFFPHKDPVVGLILAYSILAAAIFTRPVGTIVFGTIARKHGPLLGLAYSLIGVAITTVCIGLIPSHASIGWLAPFLLIIVRMIRGVFAAGESTIAKLYIMEGRAERDALLASHLYQNSSMLGIILASFAATMVSMFNEITFLWRICFFLGGTTGIVGYILRRYSSCAQDKEKQLFSSYKTSNLKSIWQHKKKILCVAITTIFSHMTYTVPFVFMNSFVPLVSNISLTTMLTINTILLMVEVGLIFFIGRLLLKHSAHKSMIFSAVILALTAIPLLCYLENASVFYVTFVRCWIVILGVIFLCPLNYWYKKIFDIPEKYLLIGMGNTLGSATIGRITPAICLYIWHTTASTCWIGVFIMLIAISAALAIKAVRV